KNYPTKTNRMQKLDEKNRSNDCVLPLSDKLLVAESRPAGSRCQFPATLSAEIGHFSSYSSFYRLWGSWFGYGFVESTKPNHGLFFIYYLFLQKLSYTVNERISWLCQNIFFIGFRGLIKFELIKLYFISLKRSFKD